IRHCAAVREERCSPLRAKNPVAETPIQCPLYSQERTNSGHPRRSEMCQSATFARAANRRLLDDLVRARENRRRDFEAESFSRLEVDREVVFCRRLHRQVRWLFAFENTIDVAGGLPMLADEIRPVRNQATGSSI